MKNKELLWKNNGIKIHEKIKVVGQVYISDYKNVINAEGNRQFTGNLKALNDSYNAYGICSAPIVVKDKKQYIVVDGWHRVHVAKKQNTDIICTIVEPECTINALMIILNTTQVNWSPDAYLNNGVVYHKNKDYIFLREVYEDTGISLVALYPIYSYDINTTEAKRRFENGEWRASTKTLGNTVIRYAEEINKYVPFSMHANFIKGFVKCVSNDSKDAVNKKFDLQHLITQLKRFPNHIHDGDKYTQHADMINNIYNRLAKAEEKQWLI